MPVPLYTNLQGMGCSAPRVLESFLPAIVGSGCLAITDGKLYAAVKRANTAGSDAKIHEEEQSIMASPSLARQQGAFAA